MDAFEVRIVELTPMRVASVLGFGEQPEYQAWKKLQDFASGRGYFKDRKEHRIFGFNNPDPSAGSPNYGYEYWICVEPDTQAEGDAQIKEFEGGLYAVAHCEIRAGNFQVITATWKRLVEWVDDSNYHPAGHQWLEEHLSPPGENFSLDLYMPIEV